MIQKLKEFRRGICLAFMIILCIVPCKASAKEKKCDVILPVQVETSGDERPETAEFEIILTSEDVNAPMPETTVKTLRGAGEISFGPMSYSVPDDYHYVVIQKKGQDKYWTYDETKYEVTVRVVNDEDGELVSEVWAVKKGSDKKSDHITFVNRYEAPVAPITPTNTPQTGDGTRLLFVISLMAASLLVMAGVAGWGYYCLKRDE